MVKKVGFTIQCEKENILSFNSQIERVRSFGVTSIEVPVCSTNVIVGQKINQNELRLLKQSLLSQELDYSVHGELSANLFDTDHLEMHKEIIKRDIEVSAEINASHLVTHFGICKVEDFENKDVYQSLMSQQQDAYSELAEYAEKHNVVIATETIFCVTPKHYAPTPSELSNQISKIDHKNLRACLDISHAYINSNWLNLDFFSEINAIAPYAEHVHIHDSFGKLKTFQPYYSTEEVSYGLGDLHLPLGWGDINFDKIFTDNSFPDHLNLNLELKPQHASYHEGSVQKVLELLNLQ